jgi:hypothetical protein
MTANYDAVALVSVLMVVGSVVILSFLVYKILQLMKRDAASHTEKK